MRERSPKPPQHDRPLIPVDVGDGNRTDLVSDSTIPSLQEKREDMAPLVIDLAEEMEKGERWSLIPTV